MELILNGEYRIGNDRIKLGPPAFSDYPKGLVIGERGLIYPGAYQGVVYVGEGGNPGG
jgi:hypothetical protein